jgi:alpha-mannosidase
LGYIYIFDFRSDFNYQNADHWYKNIDKLIHHVNLNGTVNAFYSTPSIYTEQKNAANLTWEARFDDVMPLADNANHYWCFMRA